MEQNEKVFSEVWIVIMILLAVTNDALEIIADLIALTGVGGVDEGIMEPINFAFDALFTTIFITKTGFGTESFIQLIDDILEILFIPGRTITVALGIYIANHPESTFGKGARLVGTIEGGELGELDEAAEVGQLGEVTEEGAEVVAQDATVAEENAKVTKEEEVVPSQKERNNGGSNNSGSSQDDEKQEEEDNNDQDILKTEEEEDPTDPLARHIVGEDVVGREETITK